MTAATEQFNNGICECGAVLRDGYYVGGDHDEIAYCPECGKHYGCWACRKLETISNSAHGRAAALSFERTDTT